MIIGREQEIKQLRDLLQSPQSEFVAVYGRRRVGKTFLIREAYQYTFAFQHTGILDAPIKEQLSEFRESLYHAGMKRSNLPKTWSEAFHLLEHFLVTLPKGKKVVFIDELPWMDTHKSQFIRALDHFWNGWAAARTDIVFIVCGSATSWIIENIVMNYGGLHNRLTKQIYLRPFTLRECEAYSKAHGLGLIRKQILETYMAIGGIPFYWSHLQKGKSVAENFDRMFFTPNGELVNEYHALYASLFRNPTNHIKIIVALGKKKAGMTRNEILAETHLDDNNAFIKVLRELEQCDFIRRYTCIGKKTKDSVYQLVDNYTLFYFNFIQENIHNDAHFWTNQYGTPLHNVWAGLAFERVCLQHIEQMKRAIGFSAVISSAHSWRYVPTDKSEKGVQIDLLIDRKDDVINLCEMKYSKSPYALTAQEEMNLQNRIATFIRETQTRKAVHLTMVTSFGLVNNAYANEIQAQVTMDDLFIS